MIKSISGKILVLCTWLATMVLLLVCGLAIRLFIAPIDLGFAQNTIIFQTNTLLPGWRIEYENASAGWDWRSVRPWVALNGVTLIDRRNRLKAQIPAIHVGLSRSSLYGQFGLSTINVENAHVLVSNLGAFSDATDPSGAEGGGVFRASGVPSPAFAKPVTEAFNRFGVRLLQSSSKIDRIWFQNSNVEIVRGQNLPSTHFSMPSLMISHENQVFNLQANADISFATIPTSLTVEGTAAPFAGDIALNVSFSDFIPAAIAGGLNLPEFVSYIHVPVSMQAKLRSKTGVGLVGADLWLVLDRGYLDHKTAYKQPAPIASGIIAAHYEPEVDLFSIDQIEISTGDRLITGDAFLYWSKNSEKPGVRATIRTPELTVDEVKAYWPQLYHEDGKPRGARAWVAQNMIDGLTENIQFDVAIAPDGKGEFDEDSPIRLTFDALDVATNYVQDMPTIEHVYGKTILLQDSLDIRVDRAETFGMPVARARVLLSRLLSKEERQGQFDMQIKAPLNQMLKSIDHAPVNIGEKIQLDLDRFSGEADALISVIVPLQKNLHPNDVKFDVKAHISDGGLSDILDGEGLTRGDMFMHVHNDGLTATGSAALNGVFVDDVTIEENFTTGRESATADTTKVVAKGRVDEVGLQALKVDLADYLDGELDFAATLTGRAFKFTDIKINADASGDILEVPQVGYKQPSGAQSNIQAHVHFSDNKDIEINDFSIEGDDVNANGSLKWSTNDQNDRVFKADINAQKLGLNRAKTNIEGVIGQHLDIRVDANTLDLVSILNDDENSDGQSTGSVNLQVEADEILLMNGEKLLSAEMDAVFISGAPSEVALSGFMAGEKGLVNLRIDPAPEGEVLHPLSITAQDGGALIRGMGFFAHLNGGALQLNGQTSGWGKQLMIDAEANFGKSELVPLKLLPTNIDKGGIEGIDQYLEDKPMKLNIVKIPFVYDKGLLDITSMKANGNSMGMTMEGQIETTTGKINVNGVVVPAYGLNSLLGNIPILGALLTGGDGKGVFGVTYRVKGMTEKPDVSFNPLSGIAPGFLRLIFEGSKGKVSDVETIVIEPEEALHSDTSVSTAPDVAEQSDPDQEHDEGSEADPENPPRLQ